ncbi:ankyrin repeat-containing domain protein [Tirmania nivea]|nr:ankyrin repeat-containing domain protein [Tirmania nivea]
MPVNTSSVTKQFMSQTMYWSDHIIFSMAPLGIIAAVVGTTRVAGPTWMKAIIGRARESRGVAEVELMSSTSPDICELWNGRQIVRVLGSAPVKQVLYFPHLKEEEHRGLYTLEEAVTKDLMQSRKDCSAFDVQLDRLRFYQRKYHDDTELRPWLVPPPTSSNSNLCAPNITLNFTDPIKRWHLRLAAVAGTVLQLSVVVFEGLIRYEMDMDTPDAAGFVYEQAFILAATGTLVLSLGMMLCSYAVEQCTEEYVWTAKNNTEFYLFWIQKGQVVNDQLFESFVLAAEGRRRTLTTSHPCFNSWVNTRIVNQLQRNETIGEAPLPQEQFVENCPAFPAETRFFKDKEAKQSNFLEWITVAGAFASISGFILQFVGLRGLHWTATVFHIAATILMTIVRTTVRQQLAGKPFAYQLPSGYELEWLAVQLGDGKCFEEESPGRKDLGDSTLYLRRLWKLFSRPRYQKTWAEGFSEAGFHWNIPCKQTSKKFKRQSIVAPQGGDNISHIAINILAIRERLGKLTAWDGPAPEEAFSLTNAMEVAMNKLQVQYAPVQNEILQLPLDVQLTVHHKSTQATVYLVLEQDKSEDSKWKANEAQVEALISLCLFSLSFSGPTNESQNNYRRPRSQVSGREERIRLLGPATENTWRDFEWWLEGSLSKLVKVEVARDTSFQGREMRDAQRFIGYGDDYPFVMSASTSKTYSIWPVSPSQESVVLANSGTGVNAASAYYGVYSYCSSRKSCAQHIFSIFIHIAANEIPQLGGQTVLNDKVAFSSTANFNLKLQNSTLEELAGGVAETGLCTLEEAYFGIIPACSLRKKLPRVHCVVEWARHKAELYETLGHWKDAGQVYSLLFSTCKAFGPKDEIAVKATSLLVESAKITVSLWETQHRNDLTLRQVQELVEELSEVLDKNPSFSNLIQRLLSLSSMSGRLQQWGYQKQKPTRDSEQEFVDNNWPLEFGYTPLHDTAFSKAGWKILMMLSPQESLNNADIFGRVPLHYAATNNSDAARYLLSWGANPRSKDNRDWTPLHYASWHGNKNAVRALISGGSEIDAKGRDGMTPLHCAAAQNHPDIANLLLGSGANVEIHDNARRTPLHWAAIADAAQIAQDLTKKGAYHKGREDYGRIPLHLAAMSGCAAVKVLLEFHKIDSPTNKSQDLDIKDRDGRTPLHLAAQGVMDPERAMEIRSRGLFPKLALHKAAVNGRIDQRGLLLLRNTDELVQDPHLENFDKHLDQLHQASLEGKLGEVEALLADDSKPVELDGRDKGGKTALHFACWSGNKELAEVLLDKGAEIDSTNTYGSTALHFASSKGSLEVVNLLLDKQVDIHHANHFGNNALHFASWWGHLPVVQLLLQRGADLHSTTFLGNGLLHYAATSGNIELIEYALGKGIDMEFPTKYGNTALHMAAMGRKKEAMEYLLFKGAKPDSAGHYGTSALHYAVMGGSVEVIEVLLGTGADIEQADDDGNTPLHFATFHNHRHVAEYLLSRGANVNLADKFGQTALHFAVMHKHIDMIDFLGNNGANARQKDVFGKSVFEMASNTGSADIINLVKDMWSN